MSPRLLKHQLSSRDFTELMIYYSYTPTAQQKNEIYQAQIALQVYRLRQTMSSGKTPDVTLKDFLIKPPGIERKSQTWQSEQDMMMMLAMHAGTDPEEFYGHLKDSGNSDGGVVGV